MATTNTNGIQFEDNSAAVIDALKQAGVAWLYEAGGEIEAQAKRNSRVDKGKTRNSFSYKVDESGGKATVGSPDENAIWEEFGTGVHAEQGNGGKTAWYVPVQGYTGNKKPTYQGKVVIVHGKNGVDYYKTDGKKGTRALFKAYESKKNALKASYQNRVKGVTR